MNPNALDSHMPGEIVNDALSQAIVGVFRSQRPQQVLEIGASTGEGSTQVLLGALAADRSEPPPRLFSLEAGEGRFAALCKRHAAVSADRFCPMLGSSCGPDEFPDADEVRRFVEETPGNLLKQYGVETVLGWLANDVAYLRAHPQVPTDAIERVRSAHGIAVFDAVVIDGSEFLGSRELEKVIGAGIIILDDIRTFKCWHAHARLVADSRYRLATHLPHLRNGASIFVRK